MTSMLCEQRRHYTEELGTTHKELSKLYKKLADIELDLSQRLEKHLTRQEKKKLQWSRALTKKTVERLESQQAWLHAYLYQHKSLLDLYSQEKRSTPTTLCTTPASPSVYAATLVDLPSPNSLWSAGPCQTSFAPQYYQPPQYWDLSMLHERRDSSPYALSANSGFFESPPMYAHNAPEPVVVSHDSEHSAPTASRKSSSGSEKDDLPELALHSFANSGAEPTPLRKRRYSDNAIQLIESRLAVPKSRHRNISLGHLPILSCTLSDEQLHET